MKVTVSDASAELAYGRMQTATLEGLRRTFEKLDAPLARKRLELIDRILAARGVDAAGEK